MSKNVLLVVSNLSKISSSLREVRKQIPKLVYIHLNNTNFSPKYSRIIADLYVTSSQLCDTTDVRILLSNLKGQSSSALSKTIDVLIYDRAVSNSERTAIERLFQTGSSNNVIVLDSSTEHSNNEFTYEDVVDDGLYDNVVLGGTFDRLHIGHKILLSEAVIRTRKRLVIGVTDTNMNKSKKLPELILPLTERMSQLKDFLVDIDNSINYEIVPIQDPFGPTKSDPNLDMIVVSSETYRGAEKVNELRKNNNLNTLKIHSIHLVELNPDVAEKELKVSSSNKRMDLLGIRIREPEPKPHLPNKPYIIGLTGGIASGKTSIGERFAKLGAKVINCDKLAHTIYEPGKPCYSELIEQFGSGIVGGDGRIDRVELGKIVFSEEVKLNQLNGIVWPHLLKEVQEIIRTSEDVDVVLIEAAILIKAGWHNYCHEVWSCIIAPDVAIKRVVERNNLTTEQAQQRVKAQIDNETIVKHSNVIFSSQWSYEYTDQQAKKAWTNLMQNLKSRQVSSQL